MKIEVLNVIILITLVSNSFVCAFLDMNIITSYFKERKVKQTFIAGCWKTSDFINFSKYLFTNNQIPLSYHKIDDVTNLEKSFQTDFRHLYVVLDGNCKNVNTFLKQCGKLEFFGVRYHWLILTTSTNVTEYFDDVTINIDSDILVVIGEAKNDEHDSKKSAKMIVDFYNVASTHGGQFQESFLGLYHPRKLDNFIRKKSIYWDRKNFTGIIFPTVIALVPNFQTTLSEYLISDTHREQNTLSRYHWRLLTYCSHYYNFGMNLSMSNSWGYVQPNGKFDGMIGAIQNNSIEFGGAPVFIRTDRLAVAQYGRATFILRAAFLFLNSRPKTSLEVFLKPFSTGIWLSIIFLSILAVLIQKYILSYERKHIHSKLDTTWSYLIIFTVGAFCQQGSTRTPTLLCGRIITIFVFFLSLITYQFYSASIVSQLLMNPVTYIKTVEDILKSDMEVGCEDIIYHRDFFEHVTDKVVKKLYETKILQKHNRSNYFAPQVGIKKVGEGNYAFFTDLDIVYPTIRDTFSDREICQLRQVQLQKIQPTYASYRKNSPFKDMLDFCFQKMAETGVMNRELKYWRPKKPECLKSNNMLYSVRLIDCYPALLVLAIGILSSLIILTVEIILKMKEKFLLHQGDVIYPFAE